MTRAFSAATAEQVMLVVDAVVVNRGTAIVEFASRFCDLPEDRASAALSLAVDIGLLVAAGGQFSLGSPLAKYVSTPRQDEKAAILRILLDAYDPYVMFQSRLVVSGNPSDAARQTKAALDLDAHYDDIRETLINLGTFSQMLSVEGGGKYEVTDQHDGSPLIALAVAAKELSSAEHLVRDLAGSSVAEKLSRKEVVLPLARSFRYADAGDPRSAVVEAGNAIESFLEQLGVQTGTTLAGATGINSKVDKLRSNKVLTTKHVHMGKYLGHVRNAADHGTDPAEGASWAISRETGIQYPHVSCSFIRSATRYGENKTLEL